MKSAAAKSPNPNEPKSPLKRKGQEDSTKVKGAKEPAAVLAKPASPESRKRTIEQEPPKAVNHV